MSLRNLLLVTYQFPPIGGSGVQRALKLAHYLPRAGWIPHVLCAGHTHYPLLDPTLAGNETAEMSVHRACGLEPAGVATTLCRSLAHWGVAPRWLPALENRLYWRLDRVCGGLPLPEAEMLWAPAAIRLARRLILQHDIQAVVTTSPPHSAHLVGLHIKRRLGLPWIADLRDPVLDNFAYQPDSRLVGRYWKWLERSIVYAADRVVVTCPELIDRLRERYPDLPEQRFSTITNGYDPADAPLVPVAEPSRRFVLAYVGAFYRQQSIEPVLRAFRALLAQRRDLVGRIEFRLIGSLSASLRRLLQPADAEFFTDAGYCGHAEAIRQMMTANTLLLMVPPNAGGRLCIPAKTFEYLAFGKHVLALAHPGTYLQQILQEAGDVTFVDCRRPDELVSGIEECYNTWQDGQSGEPRNSEWLERFRRDRLAADFASVLDKCLAGSRWGLGSPTSADKTPKAKLGGHPLAPVLRLAPTRIIAEKVGA